MDTTLITALFLGAVAVFALPLLLFNDRQKRRIAERNGSANGERRSAVYTASLAALVTLMAGIQFGLPPLWLPFAMISFAAIGFAVGRRLDAFANAHGGSDGHDDNTVIQVGWGQLAGAVVLFSIVVGGGVAFVFGLREPVGIASALAGSLVVFGGGLWMLIRYHSRHLWSVRGLLKAGDFEGAELELRRKLEQEPNSAPLLNAYGIVLIELERFEESIPIFEREEEHALDPQKLGRIADLHCGRSVVSRRARLCFGRRPSRDRPPSSPRRISRCCSQKRDVSPRHASSSTEPRP